MTERQRLQVFDAKEVLIWVQDEGIYLVVLAQLLHFFIVLSCYLVSFLFGLKDFHWRFL